MNLNFYSNGKLLITEEYLVLEGATVLALSTTYGQDITITLQPQQNNTIHWKSYDHLNAVRFECKIDYNKLQLISSIDNNVANALIAYIFLK